MKVICIIGFAFVLICQVVTGCGPDSGLPGTDGTYDTKPDEIPESSKSDARARRAIYDYPERPTSKVMFTVFDEDQNGDIDACEWMEAGMTSNVREFVRILDEIDKNEDNVLSVEEFEELHVRWKYRVLEGGTSAEEEN